MTTIYGKAGALQSMLRVVFPAQCLQCGSLTDSDFGLCGPCWRDTPFIAGLVCDQCGTPLPGTDGGGPVVCDDCLTVARPWAQGRSALIYRDTARKLILSFKHGDRTDLAGPAAAWMARAGAPLLRPDSLIVPVPLHWTRLLRRRFNQAALLARALARIGGQDCCPDALIRTRRTRILEGHGRDARFAALADAISPHPVRGALMRGREVLIVDDVMTSGATLAAAAEAAHAAGAMRVCVLALARVVKDA